MDVAGEKLKKIYSYLVKKWFLFFVLLSYIFFAVYYGGPVAWDCQNVVNGMGDSTAGPIWKNTFIPDVPFGGVSKVTNYPLGESLASPVDISVSGQSIMLWSISKIVGPVCSYNLTVGLGIIGSAVIMFFFVRFLLGRKFGWIAWLAGYLLAFTPYFQIKTTVHPGYAFQGLFIAVLWAFLLLIKTKQIRVAILLGVLIGICFYFDPYFSLLVGTLIVAVGIAWTAVSIARISLAKGEKSATKEVFHQLKLIGVAAAVSIMMITPIALVGITRAGDIEKSVAGTRDNIQEMARACSNWPGEYLLPFPDSPLLKVFGSEQGNVRSSLYAFSDCGIAEDAVGIALVAIIITSLWGVIALWEKLQGRRKNISDMTYDHRLVIGASLSMILLGIALALPPAHIFGFPTLSEMLISVSSIWRVIAREYVIVNIGVIILFSVALAYFAAQLKIKRLWRVALFVLIFIGAFIQYQTYRPFSGNSATQFAYSQAPDAYYWLKSQANIKSIAEYPIEKATEANSIGYYLTMQTIHGKPMLNSVLSASDQDPVRSLIKNINDPQSVPTLHSLGVTHVVVHGISRDEVEKIPYVNIVYSGNHSPGQRLPESPTIAKDTLFILEIVKSAPSETYPLQAISKIPKNGLIEKSATAWEYEIISGTRFTVDKIRTLSRTRENDKPAEICFSARTSLDSGRTDLILSSNGALTNVGSVDGRYHDFKVQLNNVTRFEFRTTTGENIRITKVGCK